MNPNNNKTKLFIIYGLTFLVFALTSFGITLITTKAPNNSSKEMSTTSSKEIKMEFEKLELMRTPEEQAQGMQNRTEFCNRCGMLFIFEEPQELNFWMKNTLFPIDIIYLDTNKKVVKRIVKPKLNNTEITYSSDSDAKYALEIPSTRADELNIKAGDKLLFDY